MSDFVWEPSERALRAGEHRAALAQARLRELPRAPAPLGRGPRALLPRARRGPRARVLEAVGARARHVEGDRVGDVVRRRPPERRDELPPPLGGAPARRPGRRLPRRGRGAARADVPRAVGGDRAARGGARRARRRGRRPRRDPDADVPRGRGRLARVRARRGRAGPGLLRFRRARGPAAPRGLGGEGGDLRRRLVPARPLAADARDRGRGCRRVVDRGGRVGPPPLRVAGARAAAAGNAARARGRLGAPVPADLHVGHDGPAEGRAPRARRLPRLDRARGRVPDRRERGRGRALRDRHGLDHGAVDGGRRRRGRRDDRLRRGAPTGRTTGSGARSSRSA